MNSYWGIANREDYENLMSEYKAGERTNSYNRYVDLIKQYPGQSDETIAAIENVSAQKLFDVRETHP